VSTGEAFRAQQAFRKGGIKRELRAGNRYVLAKLIRHAIREEQQS
jgi:hypothetical protein